MAQLMMMDVRNFVASQIKDSNIAVYSNSIDRNSKQSIGVFTAPESRAVKTETYGGISLAPVSTYPVNILVRWTEDSDACERKANEVYSLMSKVGNNFFIVPDDYHSTKIAFIKMLDSHPIGLGRDKDNVCEAIIRIDIVYYN